MKVKNKSYYKKKAWSAFSKYIRNYYANADREADCYTCGKTLLITDLQAGHGIGGRTNSVLFCEDLVRVQCVGCNLYGRGKYAIFTRKLIDELGLNRYDELVNESQKVVQYKSKDYEEIQKKYEDKLNNL